MKKICSESNLTRENNERANSLILYSILCLDNNNYMYDSRNDIRIIIYLYKLILRGRDLGSIFCRKLNYLHE